MAYARGPRTLDARVEVCLERLWALKTLWTKQEAWYAFEVGVL